MKRMALLAALFLATPCFAVEDQDKFDAYKARLKYRRADALYYRAMMPRHTGTYNPFRTVPVDVSPYHWRLLEQPPIPRARSRGRRVYIPVPIYY